MIADTDYQSSVIFVAKSQLVLGKLSFFCFGESNVIRVCKINWLIIINKDSAKMQLIKLISDLLTHHQYITNEFIKFGCLVFCCSN